MTKQPFYRLNHEQDALQGFSRTVAEIEWLLLVLTLFYLVVGQVAEDVKPMLLAGLCTFAAFVMAFRYLNFFAKASTWKLAVETWVMILLITWNVWHTDRQDSVLLNLYFLPIITSALTLGKLATLLEVALVGACYLFLLQGDASNLEVLSLSQGSAMLAWLFPMLLVGYVTTMLANDIYQAFSRLKVVAETDELTKLYNRRSFADILDKQLHQARRTDRTFSLLMADCDNLKTVNDRYGHEAGNLLLQTIADSFRSCLRGSDYAARYGGDEFVVLLADTPAEAALQVAERIKSLLESSHFHYRGEMLGTSVSIGIASFPLNGDTAEELLRKADKAMYASKGNGKNRISSAG